MTLDLHLMAHELGDRRWISGTVYGFQQGRYGSQEAITVRIDRHPIPKDPEALLSLLLDVLHEVVYHS